MKFFNVAIVLIFLPLLSLAQAEYSYRIDLKNILNDEVNVELETPFIRGGSAIFSFPKAIPGSYSNKDFGRFIKNFRALSKEGKALKVKKLNADQYEISQAESLSKILYSVADTWDSSYDNFIFQPGGTNIDAGKNVVLNNHAFFGYFEDYKSLPFTVKVIKPSVFFGSTNLLIHHTSPEEDKLVAKNYLYLADNPVLYSRPDTTSFTVERSIIKVAVYSATGKVKSSRIAAYLKPMCAALAGFFNGLPVSSYQFLFFFDDPKTALTAAGLGGYGALEHNYSSLYYLPEIGTEKLLRGMVNEVASHEFLHIQTPLNLHSKEVADFDFVDPKMSQHLWLYEGVTEYFANLVQLQNGLLSEEGFFKNMHDKVVQAEKYGPFSMTEMSKNVLKDQYKSKYESVYNKGALIGFMLDLLIRSKTNNEMDLKGVIATLSKKYGPDRPFEDDELFDELVKSSHAEVEEFIRKFIQGADPLPLAPLLETIGYEYKQRKQKTRYSIGGSLTLKFDEERKEYVFTNVKQNVLNISEGDILISINSAKVNEDTLDSLWSKFFQVNTTEPLLSVEVKRNDHTLKLSAALLPEAAELTNYLAPLEKPSAEQLQNRRKFIEGK